jgi:hypothetical protein
MTIGFMTGSFEGAADAKLARVLVRNMDGIQVLSDDRNLAAGSLMFPESRPCRLTWRCDRSSAFKIVLICHRPGPRFENPAEAREIAA